MDYFREKISGFFKWAGAAENIPYAILAGLAIISLLSRIILMLP